MKIDYTDHGVDRIRERGITKKAITEAITSGRKENTIGRLRKSVHGKKGRMLIVIYNIKSADEVSIVTAYWEQ